MASFPLIDAESVPAGKAVEVVADGKVLGVFNVDGTYHVIDGICPHAGGPLGMGMLRGDIVTCPWHGWQFNVSTGQHCLNSRLCQKRYEARVDDGKVVVEIS